MSDSTQNILASEQNDSTSFETELPQEKLVMVKFMTFNSSLCKEIDRQTDKQTRKHINNKLFTNTVLKTKH